MCCICLPRAARGVVALVALCAASADPAIAQAPERLPLIVVDVQGTLPKFPTVSGFSAPRGLNAAELPGWGPGINLGGQVFVRRGTRLSFGIGATYIVTRGSKAPVLAKGQTTAAGPTVTTTFKGVVPQASINFGRKFGWSYISAGLGQSTLTINRDDAPDETGTATKTINYGGGARWFVKDHLAFSFDLRFYAINPVVADATSYGHPRKTMLVFSTGVSFQ